IAVTGRFQAAATADLLGQVGLLLGRPRLRTLLGWHLWLGCLTLFVHCSYLSSVRPSIIAHRAPIDRSLHMSLAWQHLLTDTSARWQDGTLLGFAEPAAEIAHSTGDFACPLPGIGIIEATGAEAGAFLQGQLSNDILALGAGASQLAAYCNPKGRMLALFRVI